MQRFVVGRVVAPTGAVVLRPLRLEARLPSFDGLGRADRLPTRHTGLPDLLLNGPQNGALCVAMRHRKGIPRLGRPVDQRKALIRGLVTEVLRHGSIKTTQVRAKAIRRHVDKMITLAKRGDLHARRQALGFVYDKELVQRLFANAGTRYAAREGGYCRVIPEVRVRRGDGAPMAVIELV